MDVHDSRRSLGIRRVDNFDMELSQQSKRAKEEERRVHKKKILTKMERENIFGLMKLEINRKEKVEEKEKNMFCFTN
jgi:hypothetical protein